MNRNQLLLIALAGALLVAIPASQAVWSKGHVPLNKVQVCHKGKTKVIDQKKLDKALKKGDCLLPACDFNHVFFAGDACPMASTAGFCDVLGGPIDDGTGTGTLIDDFRNEAHLLTPACTLPH